MHMEEPLRLLSPWQEARRWRRLPKRARSLTLYTIVYSETFSGQDGNLFHRPISSDVQTSREITRYFINLFVLCLVAF